MPNRQLHVAVGAPSGLVFAASKSLNQKAFDAVLEMIGGVLGGSAGAVLPDMIDPPSHPCHRSLGHGVVPVGSLAAVWAKQMPQWQNSLRTLADQHREQRLAAEDWLRQLWHLISEWILRLLAGFAAGFGAGYISHVILDIGTPCCIPLVA